MPTPRPSSDSTQVRYRNGDRLNGHRQPKVEEPAPARTASGGKRFTALFLGSFAAIIFLALVVAGLLYETNEVSSSLPKLGYASKAKNPLMDVSAWQLGQEPAKDLDGDGASDIGWWARAFDLPKMDAVIGYFKGQGLNVGKIVPLHYENTKDDETITYQVYAEVPEQLMRLRQVAWQPNDSDMAPFSKVLVLNDGLTPGTMWDTQNPTIAADAGTKLNFSWRVRWDKNYNTVTTDRLPYEDAVFTQEQISRFQSAANDTISQLKGQIQQVDSQVQSDVQARLAQVPANPPKPQLLSSKWGGNGSGEPTKSAERMGGGTVAGAAGGAAIGAAAGDAGMGAGIGAGVGLLGGFIYDTVSKNNDRSRYQRRVVAENAERMSDWRAQVKALDKQRNQIKQDGVTEKQRELQGMASRIAAAKGHLDGTAAPAPVSDALQGQSLQGPSNFPQPTADQPTGPIR